MKRKPLFVLALATMFVLVGCGNQPAESASESVSEESSSETSLTSEQSDSVETVNTTEESSETAESSEPEPDVFYNVTFNLNYEGSTDIVVPVKEGEAVEKPGNPSRDGYIFTDWNIDAAGSEAYDFSNPVVEDVTLYASWDQIPDGHYVYTFHLNDGSDSDVYYQTFVQANRRVTPPEDPTKNGYYFDGWYTDQECTSAWSATSMAKGDTDIYASWLKKNIFEAEYVDLDDKPGMGFSANVTGPDMIGEDDGTMGCSNGFYVSYLYYNGANLIFEVESDEEVDNAKLILRLSVEFYDMEIGPDKMAVTVNGEALDYQTLILDGAFDITVHGDAAKRPFEDYFINGSVHLNEGTNTIKCEITNEHAYGGTMNASAPMFDCMTLCTNANLSWEPRVDNIEGR